MGKMTTLFANTRKNSKATNKEILGKLGKKQTNNAPIVPRTIKDKVTLAESMSLDVFGDKLKDMALVRDKETISTYVNKCVDNGIVAVDTETNGLNRVDGEIAGICLYTPGEKGIYIPVGHKSYMTNIVLNNNVDKDFMREMFIKMNNSNIKYILHNAKFDLHILHWMIGVDIVPYWDTMIASHLLNENERHGLKALWQKYCATESETQQAASFNTLFKGLEFNKIPPEIGYMYASFDPIMTYQLYQFQADYLELDGIYCKSRGLELIADVFRNIEMPLIKVVFDMEVQGVQIDTKLADKLKEKYTAYMNRALDSFKSKVAKLVEDGAFDTLRVKHPDKYTKLCVNGMVDVNIASNQQLSILFYDILKIQPPDPANPRGTGEDILKRMDSDLVSDVLEYRGMSKLLSTYIEAIPSKIAKADGKLHANFNQVGTSTGRFSSDEPNLQNIPSKKKKLHDGTVIDAGHDIRQMFIAGDGYVIVGGDFS